MLTVRKECKFDAAHLLTNHAGQCKNLHGHTYRVIVEVCSAAPEGDMVIDFKDLKRIIEEEVISKFDHAFIYDTTSVGECEIAEVVKKYDMKNVALPFRSTAENLAKYFFQALKTRIPLSAVQVYETADSCAEYRES